MSGRSGYGRSRIVGKIIHKPANMMIAGLAPRIGKSGASIRLYYQRVDECFCVCAPCVIEQVVVPLPPTVVPNPPPAPPLPPPGPPTIPPGLTGLPPGLLPPSRSVFPSSSSQLPGRNAYAPPTNAGVSGAAFMFPFGTSGACPTEAWGSILTNTTADQDFKSGGHWIMAQFNREVKVIGGEGLNLNAPVGNYPVSFDLSWNTFGPFVHGESADPAVESPFLNVKYRKIVQNSPVFKVGFGGAAAGTGGAGVPNKYIADAVYIAQNVPFAFKGNAPGGIGTNPIQPEGMAPYQWLLLDISTALKEIDSWDGAPTSFFISGVQTGQWPPTIDGRKTALNFSQTNSVPLIEYDPSLSLANGGKPNETDNRNGLLFVEACDIGVGVLGPLAPFKTPPTATLLG